MERKKLKYRIKRFYKENLRKVYCVKNAIARAVKFILEMLIIIFIIKSIAGISEFLKGISIKNNATLTGTILGAFLAFISGFISQTIISKLKNEDEIRKMAAIIYYDLVNAIRIIRDNRVGEYIEDSAHNNAERIGYPRVIKFNSDWINKIAQVGKKLKSYEINQIQDIYITIENIKYYYENIDEDYYFVYLQDNCEKLLSFKILDLIERCDSKKLEIEVYERSFDIEKDLNDELKEIFYKLKYIARL